jgi:hypothetical protein
VQLAATKIFSTARKKQEDIQKAKETKKKRTTRSCQWSIKWNCRARNCRAYHQPGIVIRLLF